LNNISSNHIINNLFGIGLYESSENNISHNVFSNNYQVEGFLSFNTWDAGYPSGGNLWSDFTGEDLYSGPNQNIDGIDRICDTPYVIDEDNLDRYPLMPKISTTIFCVISSEAIVGNSVNISGAIEPVIIEKNVTLTYIKPDGSSLTRNITLGLDGSFYDSIIPIESGYWGVKASWEGDPTYRDSTSDSVEFTVVEPTPTGNLEFILQDKDDNRISGVTVFSTSQPSGKNALSGTSLNEGTVIFKEVELGNYAFEVTKSGYFAATGIVSSKIGETTIITVTLEKEVPSVPTRPHEVSEEEAISVTQPKPWYIEYWYIFPITS